MFTHDRVSNYAGVEGIRSAGRVTGGLPRNSSPAHQAKMHNLPPPGITREPTEGIKGGTAIGATKWERGIAAERNWEARRRDPGNTGGGPSGGTLSAGLQMRWCCALQRQS